MSDLVTEWNSLMEDVTREEQREIVRDLTDLFLRQQQREDMHTRFEAVMRDIRLLRQRIKRLPALPDLAHVARANNLLSFPNGRILAVDTLSEAEDTTILRIVLMDFKGSIQFDSCINWGGVAEQYTIDRLGIPLHGLRDAPSLFQVWPCLFAALAGMYVVSFGFDRVRRLLETLAVQYDLEPLALIGECLQRRCLLYFAETGFTGLASFCRLIGHPLPDAPDCTAVDRAWGHLHVLSAIAEGVAGVSGMYQITTPGDHQNVQDQQKRRKVQ